jgi:WD40 repeat protein
MPRRKLDSCDWPPIAGNGGIPERITARSTRIALWTWEQLLALLLIAAAAVVFSGAFGERRDVSPERSASKGHTGLVEAVAFSPDGRTLASCGWDESVRLWDVRRMVEGREAQPAILPHSSLQYALAFSADGAFLAAAGLGSTTVWSCGAKGYEKFVERFGPTYRCLAFSPDGRTLALGGDDGTIRLWDMPAARERIVLRGHKDIVRSVAFSPDGRRLVSSGQERLVFLWDSLRGVVLHKLAESGPNPVQFAAFSPDGRTVAVGESGWSPQDVTLWDSETGVVRSRLVGQSSGINALAFSPDGRTLATARADECVTLWDVTTEKVRAALGDHVGWVKSVAFSPDGSLLAFAGRDQKVRIWDLSRPASNAVRPL